MTNSRKWLIVGIAAALPGIFLLLALHFYRIPTESMEDTLLEGDHVAVLTVALSKPNRGDIITFPYPSDPTKIFMKRVIGISGDHLRIIDKEVYVNGVVADEPFAVYKLKSGAPNRRDFPRDTTDLDDARGIQLLKNNVVNGEVVVPPNSYFVLGDNRDNSLDSRYWGFVPAESVMGRPIFIYWSSGRDAQGIRWNRILQRIH